MSQATTTPDREMLDRYELIAPIARGGMGSVHLARLPGAGGFQRLYAIKVMHPHLAEETEFVGMLLDEARIAARIHHPNAVPIVDVCHSPRGFYLVMDYIDGVNLAKMLTATATLPWRARTRAAIRIILDALAGLHAAHELADDEASHLGIVHRDVSPQNIMVGSDGVGRITDFGVALAASRIVASRPGLIKGKPSYMSPEQISAASVDRRADVFAMGIVLWEALTSGRLFHAEMEVGALMQVMAAEIKAPSTLAPEVPASIDAVCMKALERPTDNRWQTARAMAEALEAAAVAADLLAPAHEVADVLRAAFVDEFAARRALIRDHARGTSVSAPRGRLSEADALGTSPTAFVITPARISDSKSIPAIEVASSGRGMRSPVPPDGRPPPGTQDAARPRPAWVVPAVVGAVALLTVGAGLALHKSPPAPSPTVHAATVAPRPEPVVTPPPVVAPAAPVVVAAPAAVPAVDASVAAPAVAPAALIAAPRPPQHPRRPDRNPAEPARQPSAPSTHPSIEENPYLRR